MVVETSVYALSSASQVENRNTKHYITSCVLPFLAGRIYNCVLIYVLD